MLNYAEKTGFEICTGSGSERYVTLRRFNAEGQFEELFIARCKHAKPAEKAKKYARHFAFAFAGMETTCTQEQIDEWRHHMNGLVNFKPSAPMRRVI